MCTVTWVHEHDGYQLFCNRDEQLTRQPSTAPRLGVRDGIRFAAPMDGDFGGTWIAANEFGVTVCLLNGANLTAFESAAGGGRERRSRGLLVPELMAGSTATGVAERVSGRDLSGFAPFTIAVLEPGQQALIAEWNGEEKTILPFGDPYLPLASSSFDGEMARMVRRQEYRRLAGAGTKPDTRSLLAFHQSHCGGPGPFSPCMHRSDAQTVSFTRVQVTRRQASVYHSPAAPCRHSPGKTVKLDLLQ